MKIIFLMLFAYSCSSDVSIMKRVDEKTNDDSAIIDEIDTETEDDTQELEPSDEMSELTVGYGEIHFKQIACPPCVGA